MSAGHFPPRCDAGRDARQEVLGHYGDVAAGPGWACPREVALAVLHHDAVYVPGCSDNEARSVVLACGQIARWLPGAGVDTAEAPSGLRISIPAPCPFPARASHTLCRIPMPAMPRVLPILLVPLACASTDAAFAAMSGHAPGASAKSVLVKSVLVEVNGVPEDMDERDGRHTWHWRTRHPNTHAIVLNIGPYEVLEADYRSRFGNAVLRQARREKVGSMSAAVNPAGVAGPGIADERRPDHGDRDVPVAPRAGTGA